MSLGFLQKVPGTPLAGGPAVRTWCSHCRDLRFDPWLGRSPGKGNGYPLQYSGLENSGLMLKLKF